MNRLGMAVDISHCGDRTTLDVIEASAKPVLVTHSNCRALMPRSARCKTDEAIRKLAAKGGVMGVTMERLFVGTGSSRHHRECARSRGSRGETGWRGACRPGKRRRSGRPGWSECARKKNDLDGLEYSRKIFELTEGLIRRKYSQADIQLILGGNFQRVLTSIWEA